MKMITTTDEIVDQTFGDKLIVDDTLLIPPNTSTNSSRDSGRSDTVPETPLLNFAAENSTAIPSTSGNGASDVLEEKSEQVATSVKFTSRYSISKPKGKTRNKKLQKG
jgi:hypothetical protein